MSDFDKEAEREKLREKYERDREERQATQRMSDLLLKGATMTNAHCGTCGDPLFQMDGTTFCPSCHGNPDAVEGTDLEARPADETADGERADPDEDAAGDRGDSSRTAGDSESVETDAAAARSDRQQARQEGAADASASTDPGTAADAGTATDPETATDSAPANEDPTAASASDRRPSTGRSESPRSAGTDPEPSRPSADDARRSIDGSRPSGGSRSANGDLEAAHDSLVAALETFAAEAASTDDPRYARECLEAAREAAETLDVLR